MRINEMGKNQKERDDDDARDMEREVCKRQTKYRKKYMSQTENYAKKEWKEGR